MPPRHYSVEMGEIDLENWVMVPHHVAPTVRRAMLMKGLAVYGTAAIYPLVERIVNKGMLANPCVWQWLIWM